MKRRLIFYKNYILYSLVYIRRLLAEKWLKSAVEKPQKEGKRLLFFVPDDENKGAVFAKWDGLFFQSGSEVRETGEKFGMSSLLWDEPQEAGSLRRGKRRLEIRLVVCYHLITKANRDGYPAKY